MLDFIFEQTNAKIHYVGFSQVICIHSPMYSEQYVPSGLLSNLEFQTCPNVLHEYICWKQTNIHIMSLESRGP